MKVAAVQMTSTRDVPANLREAGRLVADAARQGAKLVVLPENFSFLGATDADRVAAVEPFGDGPAQRFLAETAESLGIWIVGGTIPIRDAGDRASSRSLLVGPDGRVAAHYDKIHLFDVDIPGARRALQRIGDDARGLARRCGEDAARAHRHDGLLRHPFPGAVSSPERARHRLVVVPAAFTVPTGEVHWLPLLQARAIESLVYVVAAGQWGEHAGGRKTYGHSMILGPWGELWRVARRSWRCLRRSRYDPASGPTSALPHGPTPSRALGD